MRRNAALDGLEEINQLEEAAGANASNLQRLEETARPTGRPRDKARFDTPNALATAVGASFILGPVGGILLGAAQGILGKREQQNALDQWAADQGVMGDLEQVFTDELDRWKSTLTDPRDLDQVDNIQSELDAAMIQMESMNPDIQQGGLKAFQKAQEKLSTFATMQETQSRAEQAEEKRLARELDAQQYSNFTSLRKDYDAQSQGFEDGRLAANKARDALNRGNPVDLVAATRLAIRTVEPTGPLTDEDVKAYANIGNIRDRIETMAEQWIGTGGQLSDPMRKDFLTMINSFERQNSALQMSRDLRFRELGEIAELPERELSFFNRVNELPVNMGGEFIPQSGGADDVVTGGLFGAGDKASMAIGDSIDAIRNNFSDQAIMDRIVKTLGFDQYQPGGQTSQQSRTRQRGVN